MNAPCKDRPNRSVGCHSTCEKYKAFREERDVELEKRKILSKGEPLATRRWRDKTRVINNFKKASQ